MRRSIHWATAVLLMVAAPLEAQFSDRFGAAVAVLDGGEVAVLKPSLGLGRAGAYLFRWSGSEWSASGALHPIDHDRTGEGFSPSVAVVSGSFSVAAADAHGLWAAHLFGRDDEGWTSSRVPRVEDAGDRGPEPMSMATLSAVAAPPERTVALSPDGARMAVSLDGSGEVTVVRRAEDGWRVEGRLEAGEAGEGSGFGAALAFGTDGALRVGAPRHPGGGAVFVYREAPSGWFRADSLTVPGLEDGARLGAALVPTGARVIAGAPGAAAVFLLEGGGARRIDAPPEAAGFGTALTLGSDELWIGAPGADELRGTVIRYGWGPDGPGELLGFLRPGGLEPGDAFGSALALRGGTGVVGAPFARAGRGRAVALRRTADGWTSFEWLDPGITLPEVRGSEVPCAEGSAAGFDCERVDLLAFLPLSSLGAAPQESVTDLWGWTDPETGREYALVGRSTGAAIVDVTDPTAPVYMGRVAGNRTHARDIKVYRDHMFFTGDGAGQHGLLFFDLTRLREVASVPVEWEPDGRYDGIASAHNLVINTETGYGYTVGNRAGGTTCGGGLHMVDLREPSNPTLAGCYTDTEGLIWQGRTHDAQCVVYRGPDVDYQGREICFALNETAVRIVDVTDKANPVSIAAGRYPGMGYVHQGWLTEDHRYFYQNDEADELAGLTSSTRTLVWNVEDLDDPVVVAEHRGPNNATDHNLYVVGDRMYQANYFAGMRVFDISDRENPIEVGHFDTTPYGGDPPGFSGGAWTAYPFFESGTVIVSSMNEGLFLLRPARPIVP